MRDEDVVEMLRSTWELDPDSEIDLEWIDESHFRATEVRTDFSAGKTLTGYLSSFGDFVSTADPELSLDYAPRYA